MEFLFKMFLSLGAIIIGSIIGGTIGWNLGKLFRRNESEENK